MSLCRPAALLPCFAAIALLASTALAQAFPAGSGALSGRGKLRVPGCDKVSAPSSGSLYTLGADGTFTELETGSGMAIVGNAQPIGSSGRAFTISYAPGVFDELIPLIEELTAWTAAPATP